MESATDPILANWVREAAASQDPRVGAHTPVTPMLIPDVVTRPQRPEQAKVFICGGVVVKVHAPGTRRADLTARLAAIEAVELDRVWLLPLSGRPLPAPDERLATIWPRATLVSTVEDPPWEDAGALLARLHQADARRLPKLPAHGGVLRFERAVRAARGISAEPWLGELGEGLLRRFHKSKLKYLVHGSFHLGQLGHPLLSRPWRLLDPDDLGLGDPAWDLARPAALFRLGRLPEGAWSRFTRAYQAGGGPALPQGADPLDALADVAQASLLITAVHSLTNIGAHSKPTTDAFLDAIRPRG
ncbi:MAG: aminoglycoside phosphotransferase family protein [Propionibacteriaceae bacterium]|jgi:hypothetical protein|nr:aminoglycoside phosphotransferase family protein [Propionibacteriaceae bacterium]